MQNWRSIKSDICDALSNYDVNVHYEPKHSHGFNATCSYFTVYIDDDYDIDDVSSDLEWVMDEYDLEMDFDSEGSFDLNAHWDIND